MAEARPLFSSRMTDAEALMWRAERDPSLRSAFSSVTFLDRAPDVDRFRGRMAGALATIPRLRQRVVEVPPGLGLPRWAEDPNFDLAFHVRHFALPAPGTRRQLLDLAAVLHEEPFDPTRPLWQFTIIEGLEGGEAALVAKMHHTISDGVGAIRLSAMFTDTEPDPEEPRPADLGPAGSGPSALDIGIDAVRRPIELGSAAWELTARTLEDPIGAIRSAIGIARQVLVLDSAHSPLWTGHRSSRRRFEVLTADLEDAKRAAKTLGGTLNDFYVTTLAAGAGAYHRNRGMPADQLRATIPVSIRSDRSVAGNAFVPTRVLVPAGEIDAAGRFALVHERLTTVKSSDALAGLANLAALASRMPGPLVRSVAKAQVRTVDFAASNVRGAPFDLYIGGATILGNHPFGPTAGTAFNATLLSYRGGMDIGINIDSAAIDDGDLLRRCVSDAIAELINVAER